MDFQDSTNTTDPNALLEAYYIYEAAHNDDVDLAPPVLRTVWVLLAISTVVVLTRFAVKFRTTRRLYMDDGLMTLAVVCCNAIDASIRSMLISIQAHWLAPCHIHHYLPREWPWPSHLLSGT